MNAIHPESIEEPRYTLGDYLSILARRRRPTSWTAGAILLLAAGLALGLPPVYRSTATILIEQQEIPQELVRSTVTTYADQRLQVIRQRVMTTSNLVAIINKFELYAEDRKTTPIEQIVEQMAEDVRMETVSAEVRDPRTGKPAQATIAFTVSYESRSPDLAQRVANELISLYLNENLETRTTLTAETSDFLRSEAGKLKAEVAEVEAALARFKEANASSLPELAQLNLQLMDRTEREIVEVERQIRALEERKIFLAAQLAQLEPTVPAPLRPTLITDRGERILQARDRLKVLHSQYLSSGARYSSDHPDLIRLKKEMAVLEAEVGARHDLLGLAEKTDALAVELSAARERYSTSHPDVRRLDRELAAAERALRSAEREEARGLSDGELENPAYVQIQAQLDAADTDLRSQRGKYHELRARLRDFENRLASTPDVERGYRALSRDHENALHEYQEIKAKQMDAQLAQSLESEQKGERFTLIEPPLLPEEPERPNRIALLAIGFVLSAAGGFGATTLSEALDDTVRGRRGVITVVGRPPLAVVPHIATLGELGARYVRRAALSLVALALLAAAAASLHYFWLPLDVLWFGGLRRLGL